MNSAPSHVELSFRLSGPTLPADHGYGLYAALVHAYEPLHEQDWLSIQTISGIGDGAGKIRLTPGSRLRLRLPVEKIPLVYPLAGRALTIGIHTIRLQIPEIHVLTTFSTMQARIVVIKNYEGADNFLTGARKQLAERGIGGELFLLHNPDGSPRRKTIKIKRFTVVGFGVGVRGLSDEDSLRLQIEGLGGKRRMGCGVFYGSKRAEIAGAGAEAAGNAAAGQAAGGDV
jgi:CRISPR-associated endonuclease/helicase Cas3